MAGEGFDALWASFVGGPRKKQMLDAPKQPNKVQQMFMRASGLL